MENLKDITSTKLTQILPNECVEDLKKKIKGSVFIVSSEEEFGGERKGIFFNLEEAKEYHARLLNEHGQGLEYAIEEYDTKTQKFVSYHAK